MKQYSLLSDAAAFAATLCAGWRFATSDENYDRNSLLGIAEIHDEENPADEDCFYVVSPFGSIGFCEDDESIDWLFLSDCESAEGLPNAINTTPQIKYCTNCGAGVVPNARFCGKCGNRLA